MGKNDRNITDMSFTKQLQQFIEEYRKTVKDGPVTSREIAAWLLQEKKCQPTIEESVNVLARHVSDALRTKYLTAPNGQRVRQNHSVRYKETLSDGSKRRLVLWHQMEFAPPNFMYESFQQRRAGVGDELWQLKQDVDYYNAYVNKAAPIQVVFDFREDMEERGMSGDGTFDDDTPDLE
jgi:hypothetical protein